MESAFGYDITNISINMQANNDSTEMINEESPKNEVVSVFPEGLDLTTI